MFKWTFAASSGREVTPEGGFGAHGDSALWNKGIADDDSRMRTGNT